jgi:hypothetical protein
MKTMTAIRTSIANGDRIVEIEDYFTGRLSMDFCHLIIGDKIGYGISRHVYSCNQNPRWVFKFETNVHTFQNVMEWELWQAIKDKPEAAKWIAPCEYISDNGMVLIQHKTKPMEIKDMPLKVPSWIVDMDLKNWGLIDGKPVLHDYGFTQLLSNAAKGRLKKHDYHAEIEKERSSPGPK